MQIKKHTFGKKQSRNKSYNLVDISVSNRFKCFEDEDEDGDVPDDIAEDKEDCCLKSTEHTLELSSSEVVTDKKIKAKLKNSKVSGQNTFQIVQRIIDIMSLSAVYSINTKVYSKLDFPDDKFINTKPLRCSSCMISHFPYFKFCHWSMLRKERSKNRQTKTINILSGETIGLVQERIKVLDEFNKLNTKLKKL